VSVFTTLISSGIDGPHGPDYVCCCWLHSFVQHSETNVQTFSAIVGTGTVAIIKKAQQLSILSGTRVLKWRFCQPGGK
jgi:hypothetical protein